MAKYRDTDYMFASARVGSADNHRMRSADFRKMVDAPGAEEAFKVLTDRPGFQGWALEDYDKALDRAQEEAYRLVEEISPEDRLVGLFRLKYDGHNLKTAIKARQRTASSEHIYSPLGTVPVGEIQAQLDGDGSPLPQPLGEAAVQALEALAKTGDPQQVDVLVDQGVLAQMLAVAKEIDNPFITRMVTAQVDVANIRAAVRLQRMGGDAAALSRVLSPGGSLSVDSLRDAALLGMDALLALVADWTYGDALAPSFGGLRTGGTLSHFEKLCDNSTVRLLEEVRLIPFGIEPLAVYLWAKESEMKAARIILASKLAGVAPEQIAERLRETYGE